MDRPRHRIGDKHVLGLVKSFHTTGVMTATGTSEGPITGALASTGFDGGMEAPLGRSLNGSGGAVLVLVLDRRDEPEPAVQPAMVEPVQARGDLAGWYLGTDIGCRGSRPVPPVTNARSCSGSTRR
jgi:hypothetical protein